LNKIFWKLKKMQTYWNNRPSIGYIFEEMFKDIQKKSWQKIKLNYLIDHSELRPTLLPSFLPTNPPLAIELSYFSQFHNIRTKWKSVEQLSPNFKFCGKRTVNKFELNQKRLIVKETSDEQSITLSFKINITINLMDQNQIWMEYMF
jgi:hypothetical protein